jgi:RluA family pseudouridine synthase
MTSKLNIKVTQSQSGINLRKMLKEHLQLSAKVINHAIDSGLVFVNKKKETHGSIKLKSGDTVVCNIDIADKPQSNRNIKIEVLYECDSFIAFNKPPGIPSQKTRDPNRFTMEEAGQKYWRDKKNGGTLILLHRLDRDTSGVLLFAKNKKSAQKGFDMFKKREVKKEYMALCSGKIRPLEGQWNTYLAKGGERSGKEFFHSVRSGGLSAKTLYRVSEQSIEYTLVHLKPHTGRTHQLRVHLAEAGMPIVGDNLYGDRENVSVSHHLLHAHRLNLPTEPCAEIVAPFPGSFLQFAKECGIEIK